MPLLPFLRPILALAALLVFGAGVAPAEAQQTSSGLFHMVWHVAQDPAVPVRVSYHLTDDQGRTRELLLDEATIRPLGGPLRLDRKRVTVVADMVSPLTQDGREGQPRLRVRSIRPEQSISSPAAAQPPQNGSKPYVTILCRFADSTSVTPKSAAYYTNLLTGSAYPSLDHYWREVSGNRINLSGSRVVGWYDLPQPRATYFPSGLDKDPDWNRMVQDCTGLADAEIDFSQFAGVNLQFNLHMWASWGGFWSLNRDGKTTSPMTWMASWATQHTYGHEIGHSLGLPHSSGPYDKTYDSRWDVMSGGSAYDGSVATSVGVHTIGHHKELLGWVPAAQKYVAAPATRQAITIERNATPTSSTDFLLAQVPIAGGEFYTIEARRFIGYDGRVPGEAVIIHRVNPVRGDRQAQVVDQDSNGNTNDAGAMWTSGEVFRDAVNGVAISVESAMQTGFKVTVRRGFELQIGVTGAGIVSNATSSLVCGQSCDRLYATAGTTEILAASPSAGHVFVGWSGACSGTGSCSVTLAGDRSVSAVFAQPVAISSDSVRTAGVMGAAYSDKLLATGGTGTIAWTLTSGALPLGMTLNGATGELAGVPEQAGTFRFTAVASSATFSASRSFVLAVTKPVLQPTAILDQLLGTGSLTPDQVRFLDLLGNKNGRLDVGDVRAWLLDNKQINPALVPGLEQILKQSAPAREST